MSRVEVSLELCVLHIDLGTLRAFEPGPALTLVMDLDQVVLHILPEKKYEPGLSKRVFRKDDARKRTNKIVKETQIGTFHTARGQNRCPQLIC